MYIQITDHCNMACAHCCYSCGPRKKNFMTKKVYLAALRQAADFGSYIAIGGGEPTTHPDFWGFLGMALGERGIEGVWLATNGKIAWAARALAGLAAGSERLGVALSMDAFHEPIDQETIQAFKDAKLEIRNVTGKVVRKGRAVRTGVWDIEDGCGCEDLFVDPNGNIWPCGCKKLCLGNVLTGWNEAGKRHLRHWRDPRFQDVDEGSCLFTGDYNRSLNAMYVSWLKGEIK